MFLLILGYIEILYGKFCIWRPINGHCSRTNNNATSNTTSKFMQVWGIDLASSNKNYKSPENTLYFKIPFDTEWMNEYIFFLRRGIKHTASPL